LKILIADDNQDNLRLLVKQLRALGHTVTSAQNGREALTKGLENPPEIVVTDILMPEMDGYELCLEWKLSARLKSIPLVFYSAAYTSDEDERFALSLGADAFIRKPAEFEPFLQILCEVLAKAKLGQTGSPQLNYTEHSGFLVEHNKRLLSKLFQKVEQLETDIAGRKSAEERSRAILQTALDGFWLTNLKGQILDFNNAFCQMLGYSDEELLKMTIPDIEAAMDSQEVTRELQHIAARGYDRFETLHRCKSGQIINVEISANYLAAGEGQIFVFSRDISERKRAERELKESEAKFQILAEQSSNMIFIHTGYRIAYVNRKCQEQLGYSKDEFYAPDFNFLSVIAPESRELVATNFQRRLRGEEIGPYEYSLISKEGRRIEGLLSINSIDLNNEKVWFGTVTDITARKKSEKALAESEERYRGLFENASIGIFHSTPEGRFLRVNPALAAMLGYQSPVAMVSLVTDIGAQIFADTDCRPAIISNTLKNDNWFHTENRCRRQDGSIITINLTLRQVLQADGRLGYLEGFVEDITERKQAEETVQEEKDRLQSLINSITDEVWFADQNGEFTLFNEAASREFRFDAPAIIDVVELAGSLEVLRPDGSPRPVEESPPLRALKGELVKNQEEMVRTPTKGEMRYRQVSAAPVRDSRGNIIGSVSVVRDVTQRKKAEEAVLEEKDRLQSLVNSITDEVWFVDQTGKFTLVNAAALRAIDKISFGGIGQAQFIEEYEVMHTDGSSRPPEESPPLRALKGELIKNLEEIVRHKSSGATRYFQISAAPVKDARGKIVGAVSVHRDVTESKQVEAKKLELETLRRLNAAKSEVLSNVAHELRTPITSIKGNIESLMEPDMAWTREQQMQFLGDANREADHLVVMIRELLDVSRIESGRLTLDKNIYSLEAILESISARLNNLTLLHPLQKKVASGLPPLNVDKVRIGEVITNLVENAAKFSPENSPITITADLQGSDLIVAVKDQGIGIRPADIGKLFTRYYQTQSALSGRPRGSGLGLAICKGIIEAHGGKIWVESEPQKGSQFSFSIPLGKTL
jgi:PAS domain S-box-containing protein